jgi:hypothetical protein
VTPSDAVVQLVAPKRPIDAADKARIIAPDLGSLRLKVNLEKDSGKLSSEQKNILAAVRTTLEPRPNGDAARNPGLLSRGEGLRSALSVLCRRVGRQQER